MRLKDRAKLIDDILNRLEPRLSRAYAEGVKNIQDMLTLKDIAYAVERGRVDLALRLVDQAVVQNAFLVFNRTLQQALEEGGKLAQQFALDDSNFVFAMNIVESNTARFLREYQAYKVTQITADMRGLITEVMRQGVMQGENPLPVARRIRDGLGLTAHQETAVFNYRRYLESLDSQALERALRDRRFDATVARAIRDGVNLTKEQVDKMVSAYRRKAIKLRSQTIARTEAIRMLSEGQNAFWEQAVNDGQVERERLRRFWVPTYDSKLREAHAAIPRLNKDGVGLTEPFKSPLGNIMFPGDPNASAANTINCRCGCFTRIID